MAQNLLEAYQKRISIAESVYAKSHNGEKMDNHRKLAIAKCLNNVNAFLNEQFENSTGTQRSDMGLWKKFCLNLVNVALPNLIAPELVMVHPMGSMSGYVAYINYTAGSNKGQTKQGDIFNNPFKLGNVDSNYTSSRVVESFEGDGTTTAFALAWDAAILEDGKLADGKVTVAGTATTAYSAATSNGVTTVTFTSAPADDAEIRIGYLYDNVVIPQKDLPILNARVDNIALLARARRIAVYYSQIAAFQAKTDYGLDLGDQLAEKAAGQLAYEIDTEVVELLDTTAGTAQEALTWSRTLPIGVSKAQHYEGFSEIVGIARQLIYDRTRRFAPNYIVIASNVLPILNFIPGFKAEAAGVVNGPYQAGVLDGLKVFVSPALAAGRFLVGVNGDDLMSSVAVYAPYLPICPTQLLQYADGGTSQGFSTLYDLKVLNPDLIVAGEVIA